MKGRHVDNEYFDDDETCTTTKKKGRPRNEHVPYQAEHPKARSVERVIRTQPHNNLPNFIGQKFPRGDDEETHDFYCASMLMLLKPWRHLVNDLKMPQESWTTAFEKFRDTASNEIRGILSGISYLHDCETAVANDAEKDDIQMIDGRSDEKDGESDSENEYEEESDGSNDMTEEETLTSIIRAQTSLNEEIHGRLAVEFGKRAKIFQKESEEDIWDLWDGSNAVLGNASGDDL
jgi:hypothetical protein